MWTFTYLHFKIIVLKFFHFYKKIILELPCIKIALISRLRLAIYASREIY